MRHCEYHPGEVQVQELAGTRRAALRLAAMVEDSVEMPARAFLSAQTFVAVATVGDGGQPWASLVVGAPGFVTGDEDDDGATVTIDRRQVLLDDGDPMWTQARPGRPIGLLAIDLGTRRRFRVNGIVAAVDADGLHVAVSEAFPNCPKYIQRRRLVPAAAGAAAHGVVTASGPRGLDIVRRADTLFVASLHPERGADVSHRGGEPGFVRVLDDHTLRVPDYAGNGMFQTLGNFQVTPAAGLAVVDFAAGRVLQLVGDVTIHHGMADDPAQPTGPAGRGTGRYWDFTIRGSVERTLPSAFAWELLDASPFNPHAT